MCIPWRLIQRLFPFLSRHGKRPVEEDEADQQQNRVPAALDHLQRTMDPLIAAQVYNNHHSPLHWLPDETLLLTFRYLKNDPVTLYCLRRVSRRFRRLINEPSAWTFGERPSTPLDWRIWQVPESDRLMWNETKQLQRYLRTDGMCDECKLSCDVPVQGWARRLKQTLMPPLHYAAYTNWPPSCKFGTFDRGGARLHCSGCNVHHVRGAFSWISGAHWEHGAERRCVAHQGAVKVCDHVGITWRTVDKHIAIWEKYKPGDGRMAGLPRQLQGRVSPSQPRHRLQFLGSTDLASRPLVGSPGLARPCCGDARVGLECP